MFHQYLLYLIFIYFCNEVFGGALRIASNGVDSVLIGGNEKSLIIDASTTFRVERLDAPIERIEIRLMDDNATQPVFVEIQKGVTTSAPTALQPIQSGPDVQAKPVNDIIEHTGEDIISENGAHLDDLKTAKVASSFELFVPADSHMWTNSHNHEDSSNSQQEYIDDLPLLEIDDVDEEEEALYDLPIERCYLNREKLSADILINMAIEKRNLSRKLKQYNTQLRTYCTPDHEARNESFRFRNCPLWREEKMIHYYKLMRLLYCSDYNTWPNAPKIKRSFGANLQLFEKLYAFMPKS